MDAANSEGGRILLVDNDTRSAERVAGYLAPAHKVDVLANPADAVMKVADGERLGGKSGAKDDFAAFAEDLDELL